MHPRTQLCSPKGDPGAQNEKESEEGGRSQSKIYPAQRTGQRKVRVDSLFDLFYSELCRLLAARPKLKFDDSWKGLPIDDVYSMKYYRWKIYPFEEAVQCHRETHHPDMYNEPNASLHVHIELNMQGEKKTRFVENFNRIAAIPFKFDHGEERTIVAFSKDVAVQKEALDAGAELAGGVELIKQIQSGAVLLQNFQFIIAHPDILPELVPLRGLMRRRFPNPKSGTLDVDLNTVTKRFIHGVSYSAKKDEVEKDFGLVETIIGTLDMDSKHLEANFAALIEDLNSVRPKREGDFISRSLIILFFVLYYWLILLTDACCGVLHQEKDSRLIISCISSLKKKRSLPEKMKKKMMILVKEWLYKCVKYIE
jgi:ribosomal protein L1